MSLLNIRIPNSSADVVAVFDQDFNQVFSDARSMKADVKEHSKLMEHPVETGITITDHRIIKPIDISLYVIIGGDGLRDIYSEIKGYFINATLLTVQTRTGNYQNMLIEEIPHEETADMFDSVALLVRLKEVQFVQAQFGTLPAKQVAHPANASTVNRGQLVGPNPVEGLILAPAPPATTQTVKSWPWFAPNNGSN